MTSDLLTFLREGMVRDAATEQAIALVRTEYLKSVAQGAPVSADILSALASFCRDHEYTFAVSAEDEVNLTRLDPARSKVENLMTACFWPIFEEALPLNDISNLRPISNAVSDAVRAQYEESPYPRWRVLPDLPEPDTAANILVAGCGTGQEALIYAKASPHSWVTGLDLSRVSLAYALAQARARNIANVRFMQGDILDVALLEQKFDSIKCSGVLHHMEDPLRGLRALTSVLADGGKIFLALYSARSSEPKEAAIQLRKARNAPATDNGIRQFRQEIFALPTNHPARNALNSIDFYSVSGTRDLLFHVQERYYSVWDVKALVEAAGLRLVRFGIGAKPEQRFRDMGFTDFSDLASWDKVEERHPGTFSGMYRMLLEKV